MKRFIAAIFAFSYIIVSSGVAMNIHYCMGIISSVDIYHTSNKCGKCGMKKGNGCCKDEFKIVKLDDTHTLVADDINLSVPVAVLPFYNDFSIIHFQSYTSTLSNNNSPPGSSGRSLCILYSIYRI